MPDYLPAQDAELIAWMTNFVTYANANLAALGLVAGDMTPITTNQTAFSTTFNANVTAQNAAESAKAAKDTARANLEIAVRTLVRKAQDTPAVTNAQRQSLGISERGTPRTPVGIPNHAPHPQYRHLPTPPAYRFVCGRANSHLQSQARRRARLPDMDVCRSRSSQKSRRLSRSHRQIR